MQQPTAFTPAWPAGVLSRFLTVGGSTVDLRQTRFITRWNGCPPFAAAEPYEIDGFQWTCVGCGAYGREGDTYHDPNFRKSKEARDDAQAHAEKCRALPRPAAMS
ncbi:hypothetical protein ACIQWB_14030 [Streptomyces olivaceus]|uniref:hypothetical protein n=1 Tax=Streptomyces olivaceus TaxID=47716 RepID=UPI00381F44A7